ncbi:ADP-ribose diphosphatase [Thioalkalivibrio sp. ALE19]|uniref:ADP-ribose diphosphatase n=1 Tax=Thioalkalivibrio sp. ALE19 TaxID=1266909 RepID=UPI0003FA7993|nr:ADP-ribose diphosphatase [Thioalkalivibrio sp. ALE19]
MSAGDGRRPGLGPEDVEVLERESLFEGFFRMARYTVRHRLFGGGWSRPLTRERFERGHAAVLLPYDPVADRVVLIEQFRIGALEKPAGPWLLEFVAGVIEPGEEPEAVVRREAFEEAGVNPARIEFVQEVYVSPGGNSESLRIYCGEVDSLGAGGVHGLDAEDEDIRVFTVPFDEAMQLMHDGRIDSAGPVIALQWLALNRERLRCEWGAGARADESRR